VSSLEWEGFCQLMLRCIFVIAGTGGVLVNTCCDTFFGHAGMGWVWSKQVEIDFVSSLAPDVFGQHYLFPRWHRWGMVKTC